MNEHSRDLHNQYQLDYFEGVERARIAVAETPYVLSHIERMIAAAGLALDHSIFEVGSGLGKFTLPLAARGYRVTANDLSPRLLERLDQAAGGKVKTLCCDIHEVGSHLDAAFDRIIGFFVLHHLMDFEQVFRELAKIMKPGGRIAFCEPVGWNPLYYLQILLTPSMRFAGEPSITAMRPGIILPALTRAGFVDVDSKTYGYFPPFIKNLGLGGRLENQLEAMPFVPFPKAFQVFTARMPA